MNDTIVDIVLTIISRETNSFYDFMQHPKPKFFAFSQPRIRFSMFLILGIFQPHSLIKMIL